MSFFLSPSFSLSYASCFSGLLLVAHATISISMHHFSSYCSFCLSASIVRLFLGTHLPSNMDITDISALLPFLRKFLLLASLQVACNESAHAIRRWRISVFLLLSPCLYFITASLLTIYSILPPVSTFLYIIIVSVNSIAFFMDTHWTFKLFFGSYYNNMYHVHDFLDFLPAMQ